MDEVFDRATVALDLMQGIMETLIVHKDRMKELAGSCWATASNLADTIVRVKGISFRQAHHVAARLVRNCIESNVKQHEVTPGMVDRAALETIGIRLSLDAETIKQALDPEDFVNTRVTEGSCNPREVERMIEDMTHMLEQEEAWISKQSELIEQSHTKLDEATERMLK